MEKKPALAWQLEQLTEDGPDISSSMDDRERIIPPDSRVAIRLRLLEKKGYVYVLHRGKNQALTWLCLADATQMAADPRSMVRIPQPGLWLNIASPGMLVAISDDRLLSYVELVRAIDGREPPPNPADTRNT